MSAGLAGRSKGGALGLHLLPELHPPLFVGPQSLGLSENPFEKARERIREAPAPVRAKKMRGLVQQGCKCRPQRPAKQLRSQIDFAALVSPGPLPGSQEGVGLRNQIRHVSQHHVGQRVVEVAEELL